MPGGFQQDKLITYFPCGIPILDDDVDALFVSLHVIGSAGDTLVMQWSTDDNTCRFIVMRLQGGVFRTVAVFEPQSQPSDLLIYEALVSPGGNQFLLRPSPVMCNRFMKEIIQARPQDYVSVINVETGVFTTSSTRHSTRNDLDKGQGHIDSEAQGQSFHFAKCTHQKDLFHNDSYDGVYAYDPRYPSNRIAVGGYYTDKVYLFDLDREEYLRESEASDELPQQMARLVFSPDGRYINHEFYVYLLYNEFFVQYCNK